jgi:hypothetical protein
LLFIGLNLRSPKDATYLFLSYKEEPDLKPDFLDCSIIYLLISFIKTFKVRFVFKSISSFVSVVVPTASADLDGANASSNFEDTSDGLSVNDKL